MSERRAEIKANLFIITVFVVLAAVAYFPEARRLFALGYSIIFISIFVIIALIMIFDAFFLNNKK